MIIRALSAAMVLFAASPASAQTQWPNQQAGDFVIKDFRFASGETIAELKLPIRRDDVNVIGLDRNLTVNLNHGHACPVREQFSEDTALPGIKVLHQHERHSGVGRKIFE